MEDRLFTTEEVADRYRTSDSTVRYWRHIKKGPRSFRAGRRVLYRESDLKAWEESALAGTPA